MVGRRWQYDNNDCKAVVVACVLIIDPGRDARGRPPIVLPSEGSLVAIYDDILAQSKSLQRRTVYLYKRSDELFVALRRE